MPDENEKTMIVFVLLLAAAAQTQALLREARGGRWSDAKNWCPEGVPAKGEDGAELNFFFFCFVCDFFFFRKSRDDLI